MLEAPAYGERADTAGRALTVEATLYIAVCLLALSLRLVAILSGPLTAAEAAQALPAYQLAQGGALLSGSTSPGLLSLQALGFWLFAANDAWARLPVLLLTALYPLAFWWLRPLIGRVTAIVAAALLLISPVWVEAGTVGLGGGLSMVAVLFCLGMAVQAFAQHDDRWLLGSGAALGLALACGGEGWQALLLGALLLALEAALARRRPQVTGHQGGLFAAGLGVSVAVFGTAALANPMGLQSVLDEAGAWVVPLLHPQPYALISQTLLLLCYEPLLLLFALLTVALVPPTTTWRRLLYLWLVPAVLLTLAGGRAGAGILLLLPAMAILAADALQRVYARLRRIENGVLLQGLGAAMVLIVYGYVSLSGFAEQGQLAYLILTVTAVGIGGALLGLVGVRHGVAAAMALAAMAVAIVLGMYATGATLQGATERRSLPQELAYGTVADPNLADLRSDLSGLAWSRQHEANELPIVIEEGTGPLVAWYTRGLRGATYVAGVPADTQTLAVLTSEPKLETLASTYVGQDYRISDSWQPYFSGYRSFLRWLLYREAEGATQQNATLWVLSSGVATQ